MLVPTQPPWNLWGNTQTLELPPVNPAVAMTPVLNTLVRVSYGRPETWRFLFHMVNHTEGQANTLPGETSQVDVSFDVIVGVGRSAVTIPNFKSFQLNWGNGGFLFAGWSLFSTSTESVEGIGGTPPTPQRVDLLTGQDITVRASAIYYNDSAVLGADRPVRVDISAQLVPNVHVRPDWFTGSQTTQFLGGEIGGR